MSSNDLTRVDSRWLRYLDGELASRATESANQIAETLTEGLSLPATDVSLSTGRAGESLALAVLSRALRKPRLLDAARKAWSETRTLLSTLPVGPGLYSGFTGVAWVHALVGGMIEEVEGGDDVHQEIESTLIAHIRDSRQRAEYELIGGLVGMGVYGLERAPNGRSLELLQEVTKGIVALAEVSETGATWLTLPTASSMQSVTKARKLPTNWRGYRNLGIAHGIPGCVALLGRLSGSGLLDAEGTEVLEKSVKWLLGSRVPHPKGLAYPSWLPYEGELTGDTASKYRVGWCYGDLGVAAALCVAGANHRRKEWVSEAAEIAQGCLRVAIEDCGVLDHGLCHGAAGVGHVLARIGFASGEQTLIQGAQDWIQRLFEMRTPDAGIHGYARLRPRNLAAEHPSEADYYFSSDSGFLMGAAGVAMTLAAACSGDDPEWDRALLVS